MKPEPSEPSSREERLQQVIADYLTAVQQGQDPDRQELLRLHPELAEELQAFFADHDRMKQLARPFVPAPAAATADLGPYPDRTADFTPALAETMGPGQDQPVPSPGSRVRYVGDYELLEELGRGGMGVVYKARQSKLKRLVALKMILAGEHAGPQELARFRSEAEAVARLQHPHIVQIYEVGEYQGHPYFSLEFCPAGSLDRKLQGTPLPPREAAVLLETLARAMHAAHLAGVVHRDLKPANILLSAEGTPKITDFGLAKKLDDTAGQTPSGAIMGTPSYMAPEQASGHTKQIGPAADVYALGAILYELLTGRPPFKAATPLDTVLQVVSEEPVPPSRLQPKVSRDLETICLKCLEKDPRKRYLSAEELAEDLRCFQAGEPVRARPITVWGRALKWARRRPAVAGLLGLVAVVAGGGVGGVLGEWRQAESARHEAETRASAEAEARKAAENLQRQAEQARAEADAALDRALRSAYLSTIRLAQAEFNANNIEQASDLLDSAGPPSLRSWEWGYLQHLLHADLRTLPAAASSLTFSPDGRWLATVEHENGRVRLWDPTHRREPLAIPIGPAVGPAPPRVAFSPDSKQLAVFSGGTLVKVLDPMTGKQTAAFEEPPALHDPKDMNGGPNSNLLLGFSPDGTRLWFDHHTGVVVWDVATGKELYHFKYPSTGYRPGYLGLTAFTPDGQQLIVVSSETHKVTVRDAITGKELRTFQGEMRGAVTALALSADGKRLATSEYLSDKVYLWDTTTGRQRFTLGGHQSSVDSLLFTPDGLKLVTAEPFHQILTVWDSESGRELLSIKPPLRTVLGGGRLVWAMSPDGGRVATSVVGGSGGAVDLWDLFDGRKILTLKGHQAPLRALAFARLGRLLATASDDGTVKLWDPSEWQNRMVLTEPADTVLSLDGKRLAAYTNSGTAKEGKPGRITVWNVVSGRALLTLKGAQQSRVRVMAFSPDGRRLAASNDSRQVKLYDAVNGRELGILEGNRGAVTFLAFSPDARQVFTAGGGDVFQGNALQPFSEWCAWDAGTGRKVRDCHRPATPFVHGALSPDGHLLALSDMGPAGEPPDGKIQGPDVEPPAQAFVTLWDTRTGQQVGALQGHLDPGASLAFSPDGKQLATASEEERTIRLWHVSEAKERLTLKGHTSPVTLLRFSPDGKRLVSLDSLNVVKVWDVATGQEFVSLAPAPEMIFSLAFSADGRRLSLAGQQEVIFFEALPWDTQPAGRQEASVPTRRPER